VVLRAALGSVFLRHLRFSFVIVIPPLLHIYSYVARGNSSPGFIRMVKSKRVRKAGAGCVARTEG
jgi:hypothetical protein